MEGLPCEEYNTISEEGSKVGESDQDNLFCDPLFFVLSIVHFYVVLNETFIIVETVCVFYTSSGSPNTIYEFMNSKMSSSILKFSSR